MKPTEVKEILSHIISTISDDASDFLQNPSKNFTRNRKLSSEARGVKARVSGVFIGISKCCRCNFKRNFGLHIKFNLLHTEVSPAKLANSLFYS